AVNEGAAVDDRNDDTFVVPELRHPNARTEGQAAVGRAQPAGVEGNAAAGTAPGLFDTIPGRLPDFIVGSLCPGLVHGKSGEAAKEEKAAQAWHHVPSRLYSSDGGLSALIP
ncbi:MAG: hypothetical protein P4L51_16200, partial [Puia sp.]|nr:hypothetical protein [Puia sp.]